MTEPTYAEIFASGDDIVTAGKLHLPTGRIVACDPYFCANALPFDRAVPAGEYDVQLYRTHSAEWGIRFAYARVLLRPAETIAYAKAVFEGADSGAYAVDSGVGSLMDEAARAAFAHQLAQYYRANPCGNYYTDILQHEYRSGSGELAEPDSGRAQWALHRLPGSDLNVAIFSSGLGDGYFESYWGLAADEEPTFLVTDFGLL
jgi:hypothetical protein